MKGSISGFNGEIPKLSSRLLPDGYAGSSVNARLVTGDLTSWNQPSSVATLAPASTINSIYHMITQNAGSDVYLRSTSDVNWARGAIVGDTTERIYFTSFPDQPNSPNGSNVPKVTNFSKAVGGTIHANQTSGNYPNNWLLLGVPAPSAAPTVTSTPIATTTTTTISDGTSLTPWTPSTGLTANDPTMGGTCIKMVPNNFTHSDFTVGTSSGDSITFQARVDADSGFFDLRFSSSATGNGPVIRFTASSVAFSTVSQTAATGTYQVGTCTSWGTGMNFTSSGTIPPTQSGTSPVSYTSNFSKNINYNGSVSISYDANNIATAKVTFSNITFNVVISPLGTLGGFQTINSPSNLFFDTIVVTSNVKPTLDQHNTSYVYTWVNELGDEGEPSPASGVVIISTGYNTVVSGINDPTGSQPTDYGLTNTGLGTKRVYRSATASDGTTQYLYLTSLPYGQTSFPDTTLDSGLQEALPSTNWALPPSDGFNILTLPNGVTVMASKNSIYPSVQNQPHAYPPEYVLTTDFEIVGLGAIDTTVIVLTKANPYIIVGSDPAQLSMIKLELPYGCVSKRSISYLPGFGVIYASPNGLVAANGSGVNLISSDYFTREQWQALVPSSIYAVTHDNRYFFWYNTGGTTGGYLFDPGNAGTRGFGLTKLDFSIVSGMNNSITAAHSYSVTDTLFFVQSTNKLVSWNTSGTPLQYTWKSKLFQMPYGTSLQYGQIKGSNFGSGLTFNVYGDGSLFHTSSMTSLGEFILTAPQTPSYRKDYEIELIGTATVQVAEISQDVEEFI